VQSLAQQAGDLDWVTSIDFGDDQRLRYRGRHAVERCFGKLKQWRGIAMRSDKLARNY